MCALVVKYHIGNSVHLDIKPDKEFVIDIY
jgi:hypothetical protein